MGQGCLALGATFNKKTGDSGQDYEASSNPPHVMLKPVMEPLSFVGSKPSFGEQLESVVADAAVGFLAIVAVFPICFFIPGAFMTWEPAAVVTVAMMFSAGLLRGASPPRNRWLKAARIDLGALIGVVAWLPANEWQFIAIVVPSLVIPTTAGVSLRLRKNRQS